MYSQYDTDDADEGDLTPYQQFVLKHRQDTVLRAQVKKHGEQAMRGGLDAKAEDGSVRSFQLQQPGTTVRTAPFKGPLRDLMKQMGLKPGPDIDMHPAPCVQVTHQRGGEGVVFRLRAIAAHALLRRLPRAADLHGVSDFIMERVDDSERCRRDSDHDLVCVQHPTKQMGPRTQACPRRPGVPATMSRFIPSDLTHRRRKWQGEGRSDGDIGRNSQLMFQTFVPLVLPSVAHIMCWVLFE